MRIPRVFHRIWFGKKLMPQEFVDYGQTWSRHHPGWQMKLWTDENIPKLQNQKYFDSIDNVVSKSDIARLEVVYNFGGVYIDTDFECLKNIEPLIKNMDAFIAAEHPGVVSCAIFGGVPRHPVFKALIDGLGKSIKENANYPIVEQTGPDYYTRILCNRHDIAIFGHEVFYPYSYLEMHRKGEKFPNAYAVHHWAHSW